MISDKNFGQNFRREMHKTALLIDPCAIAWTRKVPSCLTRSCWSRAARVIVHTIMFFKRERRPNGGVSVRCKVPTTTYTERWVRDCS